MKLTTYKQKHTSKIAEYKERKGQWKLKVNGVGGKGDPLKRF